MEKNIQYSFGKFTLDKQGKTIYEGKKAISQDTRLVELLCVLCEAYPESASKAELLDEFWPNQDVQESVVSRLIADLRSLLGDNGKEQVYIKTGWSKGYRIACPVTKQLVAEMPRSGATTFNGLIGHKSTLFSLSLFSLVGIIVFFSLWFFLKPQGSPLSGVSSTIRLAMLPLNVTTKDPADQWMELGVPALILGYFQDYRSLQLIPIKNILGKVDFKKAYQASKNYDNLFKQVCSTLECTHLVYMEYETNEFGHHLSYRLLGKNYRSALKKFNYIDVSYSAERLANHLADQIIPDDIERKKYTHRYSSDPLANRSYAIAVSDSYQGNLREAEINLKLTLEKDPGFFWAKWGLAKVYLKQNKVELASEILLELELMSVGELNREGAVAWLFSEAEFLRNNFAAADFSARQGLAAYEESGNVYGVLEQQAQIDKISAKRATGLAQEK